VRGSAWVDGDVVFAADGRPQFDGGRILEDVEAELDYVERYVCNGCRRSSARIEDLVVAAGAEDVGAACGRCDHGRFEHPELPSKRIKQGRYTRGPMPCDHDGCDCHDFYDRDFAETGQAAGLLSLLGGDAA
jgi:hypothetical protein